MKMNKEEHFIPLWHYIYDKIEISLPKLILIALDLVKHYRQKEEELAYDTLTIDDIVIDPINAKVRIHKQNRVDKFLLHGFVAPQKLKEESKKNSSQDELYTLSILLFYLFYKHHPLEGKRVVGDLLTVEKREYLYFLDPLFIFNRENKSNYPIGEKQDTPLYFQKLYPTWFREIFYKAFTKGLYDTLQRITVVEWVMALKQLSYIHTLCPSCRRGNFLEWDQENTCIHCGQKLEYYPRIKFLTSTSQTLQKIKITEGNFFYIEDVLFEVVKNPKNPKIIGLKNLAEESFNIELEQNDIKEILPKKSFPLKEKMLFLIGDKRIDIQYITTKLAISNENKNKMVIKRKNSKKIPNDSDGMIAEIYKEANTLNFNLINKKNIESFKKNGLSYAKGQYYVDRKVIFKRDDSNQVVIDTKKNLMWQDDPVDDRCNMSFQEAIIYCRNLRLGYYDDWRKSTSL
jgi:hypothetical protein